MGLALLLLLPLFTITSAADDGDLVFVNILYRHGARTPTHNYKNDPYDISAWNYLEWGQLLDLGKQQHYNLGKWLRQQYDGFLPTKYNATLFRIQSTDVDRTLMSAYSNLAGLYEPGINNWNPDIKWQPIPVHTIPENLDNVLGTKKPCPKYDLLYDGLENSIEMHQLIEDNAELLEYLSLNSGDNITNIDDLESLYGVLVVEDENGFVLPDWTSSVYPQPMKDLADFSFRFECYTPELARLKSGNLVKDLLKHFTDKISGAVSQNVWVYSAHDTTLADLMQALNIFDGIKPPYCSTLMVELRQKADDYFVLFKYMNSTNADIEPYILQIPGCESLCPLTKLTKLVEPIIPTDWEKECEL